MFYLFAIYITYQWKNALVNEKVHILIYVNNTCVMQFFWKVYCILFLINIKQSTMYKIKEVITPTK